MEKTVTIFENILNRIIVSDFEMIVEVKMSKWGPIDGFYNVDYYLSPPINYNQLNEVTEETLWLYKMLDGNDCLNVRFYECK